MPGVRISGATAKKALAFTLGGSAILLFVGLHLAAMVGVFGAVFCCLQLDPVLFLISIVFLIRTARRAPRQPAKLLLPALCLAVIIACPFVYWYLSPLLRLLAFEHVAKADELLALSFMSEHPPDVEVRAGGFRYPYFPLGDGETNVYHHAGSVYIRIPAGPGNLDFLVYVAPGSTPPDEGEGGSDVQHLAENWYQIHVKDI